MLKIAAVDVGSNAMRMAIGEVDERWQVQVIENVRLPVRLGGDVFGTGVLQSRTIRQTEEAFLRFKHLAETHGVQRLRAVATSAAREAANGSLLIDRVRRTSGIELEIISGEEEARLIHRAVIHALGSKKKRTLLLIDIGGGSVEVTVSNGQSILSTESYNIGTVRLLEKLDDVKKSRQSFGKLVREYAEAARYRIERDLGDEKIQVCAGTGGNVEEIGHLRQKLFKGESDRLITLPELEKLIERLGAMSVAERIHKLDLRPDRADVILPAAIVLHMVAKEAGIKQIVIPNVGLKDGILLDLADELAKKPRFPRREQAWESALHLGRKYRFDERHARLTARLAARLFEQTRPLHDLPDDDLLPLEIGALLHDIGHFINSVDHDKHGFYLLNATRLIGLSQREQNIAASLVRYHRKRTPAADDEHFKALPPKDRGVVLKLCALLRLADSLDVSHTAKVNDVILRETPAGWRMRILGKDELLLEHWSLEKRKALFEETFGVTLELE